MAFHLKIENSHFNKYPCLTNALFYYACKLLILFLAGEQKTKALGITDRFEELILILSCLHRYIFSSFPTTIIAENLCPKSPMFVPVLNEQ